MRSVGRQDVLVAASICAPRAPIQPATIAILALPDACAASDRQTEEQPGHQFAQVGRLAWRKWTQPAAGGAQRAAAGDEQLNAPVACQATAATRRNQQLGAGQSRGAPLCPPDSLDDDLQQPAGAHLPPAHLRRPPAATATAAATTTAAAAAAIRRPRHESLCSGPHLSHTLP